MLGVVETYEQHVVSMMITPLQLSDVVYNAATQSFEALVTVHDGTRTQRYACAIDAPITMEFEAAAKGLATQALRRNQLGKRDSHREPLLLRQRAGRHSTPCGPAHTYGEAERPHAA